jgi:acyl-coenzyme A synthetase/AMP-(fatty) acid ligase
MQRGDPARVVRTLTGMLESAHSGGVHDMHGFHPFSRLLERAHLMATQIGAGHRVVVIMPQSAAAIVLAAAVEQAGSQAILISDLQGAARADAAFQDTEADLLIGLTDPSDTLLVRRKNHGVAHVTGSEALLLMTSGTTGAPKLVPKSWTSVLSAATTKPELRRHVWLCAYPLAQFAALQVLSQALASDGTLVVPKTLSPQDGFACLRDHHVTHLSCTPTYARQMLFQTDVDAWGTLALEQVTLGGEACDEAVLASLRERRPGLKLTHIYASTELGVILSVRDGHAGFDASWLDGHRLRLDDGVLAVATESGWVPTGDCITVVNDRAHFTGRDNDVINVGGSKVMPIMVENVVRKVAGVVDVRVVGHKSPICGAIVKAMIVARAEADRTTLEAAVRTKCAAELAPFMIPRVIIFVDALETTPAVKVKRDATT